MTDYNLARKFHSFNVRRIYKLLFKLIMKASLQQSSVGSIGLVIPNAGGIMGTDSSGPEVFNCKRWPELVSSLS